MSTVDVFIFRKLRRDSFQLNIRHLLEQRAGHATNRHQARAHALDGQQLTRLRR